MRMLSAFFLASLWAQMTGVYWINGTTDPTQNSFATLQAALDELALVGAQGSVELHIIYPYDPAPEPSTIVVKPYSCTNCQVTVFADTPITIAKAPRAEWWLPGQYVLRILGGVQHFTLNGRGQLKLKSLADTTAFTGVVGIVPRNGSSVNHIRIDSCTLEGASPRGTWAAFYAGDSASRGLQFGSGFFPNIALTACTLRNAKYGAVLLSAGWNFIANLVLQNNFFGYPTTTLAEADSTWASEGVALYLYYLWGATIEGNIVSGCWSTASGTPSGIRLEGCRDITIRRNAIYNLRSLSSEGYGAIGMHIIRDPRFGASPILIENNFIGELLGGADESLPGSSAYAVAGILLESSFRPDPAATITLRHNTIHLHGSAQTNAPWARDGFAAGVIFGRNVRGGVELSGNLIQNTLQLSSTLPPDAKQTCALLFWEEYDSLSWGSFTFRNNWYYTKGQVPERTYIARVGTAAAQRRIGSLMEWQRLTGQDLTSIAGEAPAPFLSPTAPHIDPSALWSGINAATTPPVSSQDYDGELRPQGGPNDPGSAPDMGADELAGSEQPCPPSPAVQPLLASLTTGLAGEPCTFTVANPAALAGELALLWWADGDTAWHSVAVRPSELPLTLPLPATATYPGTVRYRLAAHPRPGCPGVPDTSAPLSITVTDRPGNRLATAIPLTLSSIASGVWEAMHTDSLIGLGTTDVLSPAAGAWRASLSPDLFFTFTLPACLDSVSIDLCGPATDFDTRLHVLDVDTITDRDQGYRPDCTPAAVPAAYTSRVVVIGNASPSSSGSEDFARPERFYRPLGPGDALLIAVEGESRLEVGYFTLTVRGYRLSLPKPDLGPDRTVCQSPSGIRLSAAVPGATSYAWYLNGALLPDQTDSVAVLQLPLGRDTLVGEVRREPPQPCAPLLIERDTLVLTVLPALGAAIVYENALTQSGDTLTLPFGTYTLAAQAQASGATFSWRIWDSRGVLIDFFSGPAYTREWGARGLYLIELQSQSPDCAETDTLYLRITEPSNSALQAAENGPRFWPNPNQGILYIQLPMGGFWRAYLYTLQGQLVRSWSLEAPEGRYELAPMPAGVYRLVLVGPQSLFSWPLLYLSSD